MANLDLAVARIRNRAIQMPAHKRAAYVAENIRRQQENAQRFVMARKPPAGWSVAAHEQLLHGLVALEAEFRNAGRVAA